MCACIIFLHFFFPFVSFSCVLFFPFSYPSLSQLVFFSFFLIKKRCFIFHWIFIIDKSVTGFGPFKPHWLKPSLTWRTGWVLCQCTEIIKFNSLFKHFWAQFLQNYSLIPHSLNFKSATSPFQNMANHFNSLHRRQTFHNHN